MVSVRNSHRAESVDRMAAQALRADRLFDELEFNNENTVGL